MTTLATMYSFELTKVGNRETGTGRYDRSFLSVDPLEVQNQRQRNSSSYGWQLLLSLWHFIWKTLASLIALLVFALYFTIFYFIFYKRRMYEEFWQGMANQYQELPEDRIFMVHLPNEQREFWEKFRFSCRVLRCINGVLINSMFKIRKIEGQIDPQDYIFDNHMFEVEGRYAMKDRIVIDTKAAGDIMRKYLLDITGRKQ